VALATTRAEVTAALATATGQAAALATATRVAGVSLDPDYVEVSIQVDVAGVLAGDPTAQAAARRELHRVLDRYAGRCRIGVVIGFGHAGTTIGEGSRLADAVNTLLAREFPALAKGAAFDAFGHLDPPVGQVDLRLYFFTGCRPSDASRARSPTPTT
jgi:hypothetical protein